MHVYRYRVGPWAGAGTTLKTALVVATRCHFLVSPTDSRAMEGWLMRREARARVATRRLWVARRPGLVRRSVAEVPVARAVAECRGRVRQASDDDGVRGWLLANWATSAGADSSWSCRRQVILHVPPWFVMGALGVVGRLLSRFG